MCPGTRNASEICRILSKVVIRPVPRASELILSGLMSSSAASFE